MDTAVSQMDSLGITAFVWVIIFFSLMQKNK